MKLPEKAHLQIQKISSCLGLRLGMGIKSKWAQEILEEEKVLRLIYGDGCTTQKITQDHWEWVNFRACKYTSIKLL